MKRRFTILMAALALFVFLAIPMGMRGQNDYSSDYTGNITLSTEGGANASACIINISNVDYNGIKAGTGSKTGAVVITVPSGTKYLHLHAAAWNNTNCSLAVTPEGYSDVIALTANSGISNNSPFTFDGNANTSDYYKVITFSSALTSDTDLTFTATGSNRFVIWGVTSEIEHADGPFITITPDHFELDANSHMGESLTQIIYQNIVVVPESGVETFDVQYYDAEGNEIGQTWCAVGAAAQGDTDFDLVIFTFANNGAEARTVYFKLYAHDADSNLVYSNLVTVTQAAPVIDYATLPFEWEGGSSADFLALNGVTANGLGSDYAAGNAPYLIKLDNTGDYIQVKTDSQLGKVTIDVKMIGGSNTSTITVQGSADGETFTDIETLTISGAQNDVLTLETTNTFDDNDRYVRLLFTKGSNIGVGPITIEKGSAPSIVVSPATLDLEAVGNIGGMQMHEVNVTCHNLDIIQHSDFTIQFYDAEGEEQAQPAWILPNPAGVSGDEEIGYLVTLIISENTGAARSAYFKIYANDADNNLVYSNLVTINQAGAVIPSITITPDHFELDANSHMGESLTQITYQNIVVVPESGFETFDVQYYDAESNEIGQTWCAVGAAAQGDTDFDLVIFTFANDEAEARTVYFKLYAHDADSNLVYSNLVTVTQAAPVIDYATLPFEWEGGSSADFLALNGVTSSGLGSDYAAGNAPYLIKFDGTGDYIQMKCDQQPGKVTIGVKMIGGGNTSTITVQGSADGETFTDIEELTISGAQGDELTLETTNVFAENDRYVRMLFTKGSNVGVGPITIEKGLVPSIVVTPATINLEAIGTAPTGNQIIQVNINYHNFEIESFNDFTIQFYDAQGEEQNQPDWISTTSISGGGEMAYFAVLFVAPNEGSARSTYFKVFALGEEDYVYSNLVTINQAGVAQQYTLTVEPFENLDLITFVNDEMVMEADGEIQVNEGDQIMLSVVAMEGYVMETLMVNGVDHVNDIADDFTYSFEMPAENVTISATAVEDVPPTPGEWVMVSLNDLTEDDVFVIVGVYDEDEFSFAMPNNGAGAPSAVDVTMVGNTLAGDIAENLKWNLSIGEDGYTFYPNGETESWLYCNNTNNGVRVGTNENNVFTMTPEGYLYNNATSRYIGIYNRQDWRCYTSINNNIKNQTFAFYKRVDEGSLVTYTLDIEGYYDDSIGGYYLIASPVYMIRPTFENGFINDAYDLYYFDQAQNDFEWRNYKAKHFNIAAGKGYLYASQENTTLTFTGLPYEGDGKVALDYVEGVNLTGWNLIGNPYPQDNYVFILTGDEYAEANFYVMNENGDDFELAERSSVRPMEGVLVEATAAGQFAYFSDGFGAWGGESFEMLNIRVSDENGKGDFARVRFGEGNNFEKFMLNADNTKIYFPVDNEEYAVVYADNMGEMPLNFSAAADGNYTLNINPENMEMEYLHLIDNMTGMDVDLLVNPDYTFEATTNDNAARFTLVFASLTGIEENSDNFAFFSNGSFIVSNEGNAMLQVVDMTGRIVKSENINGTANVHVDAAYGVYMLRLVSGNNVKTQKVVVR